MKISFPKCVLQLAVFTTSAWLLWTLIYMKIFDLKIEWTKSSKPSSWTFVTTPSIAVATALFYAVPFFNSPLRLIAIPHAAFHFFVWSREELPSLGECANCSLNCSRVPIMLMSAMPLTLLAVFWLWRKSPTPCFHPWQMGLMGVAIIQHRHFLTWLRDSDLLHLLLEHSQQIDSEWLLAEPLKS